MADKEEGQEHKSRGNDWEVVSLTDSAYAASPGPKEAEIKDNEDKDDNTNNDAETSHALFVSRHFAFPPTEHEKLSLNTKSHDDDNTSKDLNQEERSHGKDEDDLSFKGLMLSDEFSGLQSLDEKSKKEDSICSTVSFGSLENETMIGVSSLYKEKEHISEPEGSDIGEDVSPVLKPAKDEKNDGSKMPCDPWWRRGVASLYANAKEANTVCSIFIAAAVMGLVILGQRWQQERWQVSQLKWQSSIRSEKGARMSGPIFRLKDVVAAGNRQSSSSNHN